MKRLSLFAAVVGVTLVSAAPPPSGSGPMATSAGSGYPPCSRTVTDRCIQLYERGVRTPRNLAMNARLGPGRIGVALARAEPTTAASHGQSQHASHAGHEEVRTSSRSDCSAGDGELG